MSSFGVNWNSLARRKYDLQAQQTQAGMVSAQAQRTQAQTAASLAPSAIADTQAQTAVRRATAAGMPALDAAQIASQRAAAGLNMANAAEARSATASRDRAQSLLDMLSADVRFGGRPTPGLSLLPPPAERKTVTPGGQPSTTERRATDRNGVVVRRGGMISGQDDRLGFAKGTARVPGKGSPKKDTVKAKLAPGEAVLNAEAAETMGRGLIAALNAVGATKMGLA